MKLKTRKSISKRFKITGKRKLLKRPAGQDHFNFKDSGKTTRRKRKTKNPAETSLKAIKKQIPYI